MRSPRPYKWLAQYYDSLFTFHWDWFAAARDQILAKILPGVESACDLACGTGSTALSLAKRGIRMYGVDLSPTMCRLSREKARRSRIAFHVLHADMRAFRLREPVDLVLCEFDALNHVRYKSDLDEVARCVSRALSAGGYFYFDVNTRLAFEKVWPTTWWLEQPGVAVVMHGDSDPENDRAWTDVEWFVREGRLWRRHTERVEEVCWSNREIHAALRSAGFDSIRSFDAAPFFGQDRLTTPGCRTFFLARKRKN